MELKDLVNGELYEVRFNPIKGKRTTRITAIVKYIAEGEASHILHGPCLLILSCSGHRYIKGDGWPLNKYDYSVEQSYTQSILKHVHKI